MTYSLSLNLCESNICCTDSLVDYQFFLTDAVSEAERKTTSHSLSVGGQVQKQHSERGHGKVPFHCYLGDESPVSTQHQILVIVAFVSDCTESLQYVVSHEEKVGLSFFCSYYEVIWCSVVRFFETKTTIANYLAHERVWMTTAQSFTKRWLPSTQFIIDRWLMTTDWTEPQPW